MQLSSVFREPDEIVADYYPDAVYFPVKINPEEGVKVLEDNNRPVTGETTYLEYHYSDQEEMTDVAKENYAKVNQRNMEHLKRFLTKDRFWLQAQATKNGFKVYGDHRGRSLVRSGNRLVREK